MIMIKYISFNCIKCKKNDEEVKDKDKHNIYRICGYIIYTEKKI